MSDKVAQNLVRGMLILVTGLFGVLFFLYTLLPYLHLRRFWSAYNEAVRIGVLQNSNDKAWYQDRVVGGFISFQYLNSLFELYRTGATVPQPLFIDAIQKMDLYLKRDPSRYDYFLLLARSYGLEGEMTGENVWYEQAEKAYAQARSIAPFRQDTLYAYAIYLSDVGRIDEGIALLQNMLQENAVQDETHYVLGLLYTKKGEKFYPLALEEFEYAFTHVRSLLPAAAVTKTTYEKFLVYFYQQSDLNRLDIVAKRLGTVAPEQEAVLQAIRTNIEEYHRLPNLRITK